MMARNRIRLDGAGIQALMKSAEMRRLVDEAAEKVASNIRAQGIKVGDVNGGNSEYDLPVKVSVTTTDRAHAEVTLAHPAGIAVQAKHGALTRAASAEGLTVESQ